MGERSLPGLTTKLAVALLAVQGMFAAEPSSFRLPPIARPARYQLDLTLVPGKPSFQGTVTIDVEMREPTRSVWLNAKDLGIQEASVLARGTWRPARWSARDEFLEVHLPEESGPGSLRLRIRYTGRLDDKSNVGAYRKQAGGDWYVYTSFTPIDARRAFPCFDEPEYKAPWEVTLHVPRDDVAVANARALSQTDEGEGMKRVVFAPTLPLASEVVAFAVGPFDVVDAGVAGRQRVPVRILTPRGRAREARAARDATPEILARLEDYTGIPYPWDKLDHLAVLDMPFGAIENPGLITYRDRILLAPPERDKPQRHRAMREIMAHELAHQWFGNLVTQAWWDDVWLSEGFATWLGTKISDLELPSFERGLAMTEARDRMMAVDTLAMRPVRLAMHSRQEMEQVYSGVVYQKGAAILEMMEDWIGRPTFQRALHRYLAEHRFGNATTADLARAIQQESKADAAPILSSFLDRPGAPLLRISLSSGAGPISLRIEQPGRPWVVPVCFHPASGEGQCQVVSGALAEIPLAGSPAWIWPNGHASGYYRSALAPALLKAVLQQGYEELTEPERLALAGDLELLAARGEIPVADVMPALPRMAHDPEARVRGHALATALAASILLPENQRAKYALWLRTAMGLIPMAPEQASSLEEFLRSK